MVAIEFDITTTQRGGTVQGSAAGRRIISRNGWCSQRPRAKMRQLEVPSYAVQINATSSAATPRDIALVQVQGREPPRNARFVERTEVVTAAVRWQCQISTARTVTTARGRKNRSLANSDNSRWRNMIQRCAINSPAKSGEHCSTWPGSRRLNTAIIQDSQNLGFSIAIDSVKPLITSLQNLPLHPPFCCVRTLIGGENNEWGWVGVDVDSVRAPARELRDRRADSWLSDLPIELREAAVLLSYGTGRRGLVGTHEPRVCAGTNAETYR